MLLNGCAGKSDYELLQSNKTIEEKNVSSRSIEYRILPQDRLDVTLFKDPQQNIGTGARLGESIKQEGILVNASGYITLPLIEKIKVAGLTQSEAAEHIMKEYKKHLNSPTVYVEVMNKRLYVLGEVKTPGVLKLDKEKMTLFEALAFAGGLTDSAVRSEILIISNDTRKGMKIRKVDLTNFDTMRYAGLMLRPNDIVYVKPNKWKKFKVASDDMTSPFETISKVAAPFVTLKYLSK
ncbi:sugar transporter [Sulfurovum lithotrophicum]|uniref:Sugar transporter n=2 Tax=Sulfurovum lithotrophicum TaxID=206403 RepID=A0A7U4M2Z1_9BACT|nr:sugar transporter [Sulfurovum lithotrophicum]